ncbi:MAG TPA: DUF72 domain-containing protein, partial [Ottowia sp.]|nr:DUF72 domain-containing protein [Ottowia sp.]
MRPPRRPSGVQAAEPAPDVLALADALPRQLRLGTSSWNFPGWAGLVWDGPYAEAKLSKEGLAAYARHPLLRTVSLDRAFYRPLSASQYAHYAAQVPDDFRLLVKAPSLVCDALMRSEDGRGMAPNAGFLNAELAVREFIEPVLQGLGNRAGALVFQVSPLPRVWLGRLPELIECAHLASDPTVDVRLDKTELYDQLQVERAPGVSGYISITRGCDKFCTFCIVPYVRGRERSLPPDEVVRQVRELADAGYQEV